MPKGNNESPCDVASYKQRFMSFRLQWFRYASGCTAQVSSHLIGQLQIRCIGNPLCFSVKPKAGDHARASTKSSSALYAIDGCNLMKRSETVNTRVNLDVQMMDGYM
jgi:hypothetical protein